MLLIFLNASSVENIVMLSSSCEHSFKINELISNFLSWMISCIFSKTSVYFSFDFASVLALNCSSVTSRSFSVSAAKTWKVQLYFQIKVNTIEIRTSLGFRFYSLLHIYNNRLIENNMLKEFIKNRK